VKNGKAVSLAGLIKREVYILTLIYRMIAALVLILTIVNLFEEKEFKKQINAALVVIPLVLRILMIK